MTCVSSAHALLHALRTIPRRSSVHCIPIAQRRNVRCRLVGLTLLAPALFFAQCPLTVNAGPDQFACTKPATFSLNGSISGSYQSFLWSPTTGMTGANTLSPTVTVSQTTSYVLRAKTPILSQNLILNGDFEQGNTGFSSDYIYNPGFAGPPNPPFGSYDVAPFPVTLTPCPDHTGGGNYMIVDGSEFPNKLVWCQTVPVTPNTEYMLSTWVTSINLVSPFAQLKFTVNGNFVGTITAPGQCAWIQFTGLWNSGASTSATICIEDLVVGGANNDFGIDDLGFYPTCVVTDTVTVHITNIQAVANPASVSIPCDGTSTTLNGAGSSTGPGITYLWDTPNGNIVSGETTLTPTVNATGAYTLTVTYNAGNVVCTKTATVNVLQSLNPLTTWITPPPPLGCGNTQVVLNGIASQTSVTYAWTTTNGNIVSGGNTSKATVDKPGLYLLTVTNSVTGCTATAQVSVIAVNNPPTANATALGTINCITKQVNLSGTGSSTGAGITYLWTTPNGTIVSGKDSIHAVASAGGAYILSVSLSNCISKDTVLVSADTALPVAVLKKPDTLTCRADTLVLSAQISPIGALPVWIASAGGHIASGDSTAAPKINSAGIYTLTVTNPANGCSTVMTDTVIANQTPPSAKIVQPPPLITCQIPQVMLSGAGSSTGSRFTYLWSGPSLVAGSTTLSPKVDQPGLYTLLVTDTLNGCVSSSAITVSADVNFIVATVQVNDTLDCVSNTVLLTSNGSTTGPNISYQWSIPAGIIVSNQTASTLAVNQADIYTLRVSDIANGCSATASVTVVKNNTPPIAQIQSPVVLTCKTIAQVLQAQASGGTSLLFSWGASNGGKIILGSNTLTPTVNAAGTYTLSVTNAVNGCTATQSVVVQQDTASPSAIILTPGKLDCNVKQLTLHTTGSSSGMDFSFQWAASNNGNIVSGSTGPSPLVDRAGHYALTVTNTTNGCTATATTQVQADAQLPDASIQTPGILTCQHPLDTLQTGNPDPSFTYQWMTTNGQFFSGQNSASPVVSAGGNYALTVTNPITGCSNEAVVTVLQNTQAPAVQIQTPAVLTCKIATQTLPAQVAGSGGFTYAWTASNGGNITSGSNTPTPTVDKAGTYTLLVSDPANGCTVTASIAVQQDTASPLAKIAPPAKITCKTKQLIINTAGSSSGPNFNFVWTASNGGEILSGANSPTPTVGKAGDYTLTLTNTANGCTTTAATSVLADEAPPGASILPPDSLTCAATQITLQAAAPNQNFTYQWTTIGGQFVSGQNTADPIVSATGSYSLTVTHPANGCSSTAAVQVYADKNIPPVAIAKPDTLTCILQQLTLVGSSNGSALSYAWSGSGILSGDNTLTPVVETAGTYTLTVRDLNNGCSATATVSVYSNTVAPLVTSISPKGILTCKTLSVNIFSSNTAIKPAYQWSGSGILSGDHSASPEVNIPGLYTVTVTNQTNGCTATATATVAEDKMSPVLSIPPPPPLTCAQLTVTLQGMVSQPASTFSAAWTSFGGSIKNGANTLTPEADEPGVYVLTVQYTHNGCTATASTTILENKTTPICAAGAAVVLTCTHPQSALSASADTGGDPAKFAWAGPLVVSGTNTLSPVVGAAGTYDLTVTNLTNGCTATATTTATMDTIRPIAAIAPAALLTCATKSLSLDATGSSTGASFAFDWTTTGGNFLAGKNTLTPTIDQPGLYKLLIFNQQNGCNRAASVTVNQNIAPPIANAGPPQTLHCKQLQGSLSGSSVPPNVTYSWTGPSIVSGNNTAQPVVDAHGIYTVTVTRLDNGCVDSDKTTVTKVPLPNFVASLDPPNCKRPSGEIVFDSIMGGQAPFDFSADGGLTFQSSASFINLKKGNYVLVLRDHFGCSASQNVNVPEVVPPTVQLPPSLTVALGDSDTLRPLTTPPAADIVQWAWTPATYLSCTDCPEPVVWTPLKRQLYQLTITDAGGCTASASTQVFVNRRRQLYAPNVFSPNGDGINDAFTLYGHGTVEIRVIEIFDRWGELVWRAEHLALGEEALGWNGQIRGQDASPAVFIWKAEVVFVDGETEQFSGDITVTR